MNRLRQSVAAAGLFAVAALATAAPLVATDRGDARQRSTGWQLPPDAPDKTNPLTVNDTVLADGKKIFADKCRKCHGPQGLGDGPDADPERIEEMNLTNPKRAERNADGIVFYKVSNGRAKPKMPAFKDELNETQVWSVVAYVQSLRKK
jgi:mono/diheme cytochrome c family protein